MNEFDKETDESHDGKPNRCGHGDLLEFWRGVKQDVKKKTVLENHYTACLDPIIIYLFELL